MEDDELYSRTLPCISVACTVRILPTANPFDISCPGCENKYCVNCCYEPHFPLTCEERLRWQDRNFEEDPTIIANVKSAEANVSILYGMSKDLLGWKKDLVEGCFDEFTSYPDLPHLHEEIEKVLSFFRGLQILLCFKPEVYPLLKDSYLRLVDHFNHLYAAYPSPLERDLWSHFVVPRYSVADAMTCLLRNLQQSDLANRMLHGSYLNKYMRLMNKAFLYELNEWWKVRPPQERQIRFQLEKWESVASYGAALGLCAICQSSLDDLCLTCDATRSMKTDCTNVTGACNHTFHVHCISPWLANHDTCPLDKHQWLT